MRFWPKRGLQIAVWLAVVVCVWLLFGPLAVVLLNLAGTGFFFGQGVGYRDGLKHGRAMWEWSQLKLVEEAAAQQYAPGHPVRAAVAAQMAEVARRLPSKRLAR